MSEGRKTRHAEGAGETHGPKAHEVVDEHAQAEETSGAPVRQVRSVGVLLCRVTWMLVGPAVLLLSTHAIITKGGGWLTTWDAVFVIAAALMILARWLEQRSGTAMTATGEPSTLEHFKRYARTLAPVGAGAWGAANVVGNHLMG